MLDAVAEPDNGRGRLDERIVHAGDEVDWLRRRHPDRPDPRGIVRVEGRRLDFGDDAARVRKEHGPENLAAVQRLVLGLAKRSLPQAGTPLKAKRTSMKTRRFLSGLDDDYPIRTLTGAGQG